MCQFDAATNKFKAPSVATRLGTLLKKMGNLLATECIKKDDDKGLKDVENFLKLLQEDYGTSINKIAEETITQNKRHTTVTSGMEVVQREREKRRESLSFSGQILRDRPLKWERLC